uniref:Stathmin n=1 Tax=Sphaeramia orbicularis TaxID=375764 RepID=A0A672Y5T0_9TELE
MTSSILQREDEGDLSFCHSVCSCLYPETRKNAMGDFEGNVPINKRASGQALEVILKASSPVSETGHCITSPPKRGHFPGRHQKKLEAAEDRRKEAQVLRALAEKREHERDVLRMAEEKLQLKMEQIEENRSLFPRLRIKETGTYKINFQ